MAVPEEGAGALLEQASSAVAGASVQPSYLQFLRDNAEWNRRHCAKLPAQQSRHRWLHQTLLRQPRQARSPHPRAPRKPKPHPQCSTQHMCVDHLCRSARSKRTHQSASAKRICPPSHWQQSHVAPSKSKAATPVHHLAQATFQVQDANVAIKQGQRMLIEVCQGIS